VNELLDSLFLLAFIALGTVLILAPCVTLAYALGLWP
jgi:hypothetical protein